MKTSHVLIDSALFDQLKHYVDQMKAHKHLTSINECVNEAMQDYLDCTAPARLDAAKKSFSARTAKPKRNKVA